MWKSFISSMTLLAVLSLMTGLQACTNWHDNGDVDKVGPYKHDSGFYGGSYSGKGPAGGGVQ